MVRKDRVRQILIALQGGEMTLDEALQALKRFPFEDVAFANIDHHRALRRGFPEVVLCQGKKTEHVVAILKRISEEHGTFLATRVEPEMVKAITEQIPDACHNPEARVVHPKLKKQKKSGPIILVVSAGTSDIPVAEEAAVTAEVIGHRVERIYDVGVAGLHRLLGHWDKFQQAGAIIVVAGMEGALASVVGGLVNMPVIAVPTSVGYGASFGGVAALLAMLNSCAAGVTGSRSAGRT
ncbi:nickel pincer cofactor biosynthesis protein LarB, partial [Candidatus Zixiibacteriota bacterium]